MKQFTKYGLFSMALLAGAAAFTACSSDDNLVEETAPVNPSYNGETVKTQFAINIPRAATAGKRMTASDTQNEATPNFLGMGSIYLMPMDIGSSSIGGTSAITEIIGLSDIGSSDVTNDNGQKIYSGKYSERPEEIIVSPGTYDVKLHSMEFGKPRFNAPLFGDEQTVIVEKNKTVNVTLLLFIVI